MLKTDTSDVDYEEISRIILYIRPITLRCTRAQTYSVLTLGFVLWHNYLQLAWELTC